MVTGTALNMRPGRKTDAHCYPIRNRFWKCYETSIPADRFALWNSRNIGRPRPRQRVGCCGYWRKQCSVRLSRHLWNFHLYRLPPRKQGTAFMWNRILSLCSGKTEIPFLHTGMRILYWVDGQFTLWRACVSKIFCGCRLCYWEVTGFPSVFSLSERAPGGAKSFRFYNRVKGCSYKRIPLLFRIGRALFWIQTAYAKCWGRFRDYFFPCPGRRPVIPGSCLYAVKIWYSEETRRSIGPARSSQPGGCHTGREILWVYHFLGTTYPDCFLAM